MTESLSEHSHAAEGAQDHVGWSPGKRSQGSQELNRAKKIEISFIFDHSSMVRIVIVIENNDENSKYFVIKSS